MKCNLSNITFVIILVLNVSLCGGLAVISVKITSFFSFVTYIVIHSFATNRFILGMRYRPTSSKSSGQIRIIRWSLDQGQGHMGAKIWFARAWIKSQSRYFSSSRPLCFLQYMSPMLSNLRKTQHVPQVEHLLAKRPNQSSVQCPLILTTIGQLRSAVDRRLGVRYIKKFHTIPLRRRRCKPFATIARTESLRRLFSCLLNLTNVHYGMQTCSCL